MTIPVATSVSAVEKVPQISNASTSPVITTLADNDFLFRTVPHDALQGTILANVMKQQGIDKVSVIYINNDYGQGLAEALQKSYTGEITDMIAYEEKQASYRSELQKAKQGGADTLVLIGYPGDGIPILRQSLEDGAFDNFVFTDGMKANEVGEAIGAPLDGTFGTAPSADSESSAAQTFRKLYETKNGELPPQPFIDAAYDAGILMALAIEKAGSTDGTAVRDALCDVAGPPGAEFGPGQFAEAKAALERGEDINYQGAAGSQDFDANGDVPGTYSHWAFQGGKVEEIELIRHHWKIDNESPSIEVRSKRVEVLVTSPKLKKLCGDGAVAVTFPVKKGRVFHVLSHFGRQSSSHNEATIENMLVNFLIEVNVRMEAAN